MLKFLRKYDKWILAVGGSLLMVAFLLPQALQQLGQSGGERVVATFAGGTVTAQERIDANTRVRFLASAAGPVLAQLGVNEADHWVMLVDEARRGGFIGGPETGREYFSNLVRAPGALILMMRSRSCFCRAGRASRWRLTRWRRLLGSIG